MGKKMQGEKIVDQSAHLTVGYQLALCDSLLEWLWGVECGVKRLYINEEALRRLKSLKEEIKNTRSKVDRQRRLELEAP